MQGREAGQIEWLQLPAAGESIEPFLAFVSARAEAASLPPSRLSALELAIEELLLNVANYAYDGQGGTIRVGCGVEAGCFVLFIDDNGKPFDPLAFAPPDVNAGIDERPIGGLGIHLVRTMVDAISYTREGNSNRLKVVFKL